MGHAFTIKPDSYTAFENEAEQIEKCKEWGLLSEKATKSKAFFYRGNGLNIACSIIGWVDNMTAVIELENHQHCIHPSYLKEMQASSYGQKSLAAADPSLDLAGSEPDSPAAETAAANHAVPSKAEALDETGQTETVNQVESEAKEAPKVRAKKEKAPKLQLPEEKVKMTATVQEFTTVPNHFSDNDDEVVIYGAVTLAESGTEIGTAWSSHSATLKKSDLQLGDKIAFEGKLVAKKLTKHPVPYKINNPAKIQKEDA
ncbi:hypothetical protein [Paenibacillus nasutitermitis]|uniref:Uncharacterized protein n=1 Tax=Paenibacillus nasutitermitis TaxID=1652958 RepID=A0A916YIP7_9BACL|nr:hypothetical protein [Paenibacillus nasutitermitis]GGD46546.1 hypothetical protein GCM10010911_00050 [Paenibacillus nasutitermitis]